ncbi:LPXTG cell wall anchor domain-containing protein [Streptomyces sp. NBC_01485]|uniref:LPXTG cell wall anchor domain-containing protein n=1 Tax=Streptomyces sp. NBC_01485 TaxID=2903884 RepID=UPI002E377C15|nr:LPXTG cell wall anchor domain-containing protein [Streptomyces sp. NBC_01485]
MKLRRTMVAAAATAVIASVAPLALLSAPAAFAEESGSPSASASPSDSASASPSGSGDSSPSASGSQSDSGSDSKSDIPSPSTGSQSGSASGSPSGSTSPSGSPSQSSSGSPSASASEDAFDPFTDCKSFDLDDKLTAQIKGLPGKIVAGSGWHDFQFVVKNGSDHDLKNVYIDSFMEYGDETDEWLSEGLAVIQVKEDGKWTDGFQDSYEDEHGKTVNVTGSFVGLLDSLAKGDSSTLDLRVKVKASAPAGSSFALSEAIYAGEGSACYGNGDFYDVQILAAGGDAGDVDDAKPNGDKPTDGAKPQGGAKPISGSLASTGSDSALPMIGLVGGVAVVAGAGAVFAVRRRRTGAHA